MACANTDRAKQRLQQLPAQQRANAEVIPLEITDEDSIEAFLGTIKAQGVLIDGLVVADRTIESKYHSKHGYELTYLNNFIGPSNLIKNMVPLMSKNGSIVSIQSILTSLSNANKQNYEHSERTYRQIGSFADSMMARALYMQHLAAQEPHLHINSVNLGLFRSTLLEMDRWYDFLIKIFVSPFCRKPEAVANIVVDALASIETNRLIDKKATAPYPIKWQNADTEKQIVRVIGG